MNIACTVERMARDRPKATALVSGERRISFADLNRAINRLANGLRTLGIGDGDRVAIMLPNVAEFVYAFYACQKIGAVAVPFNTMYKGREIRHILRDSGACAIVCLTNFVPVINEVRSELPALRHIITTGERGLTFADPDATVFVQAVAGKAAFSSADDAYRRTGDALVQAFHALGVAGAEYVHVGAVRCAGRKLAGFTVSTVEDLYVVNALCFVGRFDPSEFLNVIWVPPEVKDKLVEPVTSVAEETGRRPEPAEVQAALRGALEKLAGGALAAGEMTREERFGYAKQRSLLNAGAASRRRAEGPSLLARIRGLLGRR